MVFAAERVAPEDNLLHVVYDSGPVAVSWGVWVGAEWGGAGGAGQAERGGAGQAGGRSRARGKCAKDAEGMKGAAFSLPIPPCVFSSHPPCAGGLGGV